MQDYISSMKACPSGETLFIGSKDMRIYQIDLTKGKLFTVYEGHWEKITKIFLPPTQHVLLSIAETNIKVWDLEFDEQIKMMNEHESAIIYVSMSPTIDQAIVTISQTLQYIEWNLQTGVIETRFTIQIDQHHSNSIQNAKSTSNLGDKKTKATAQKCHISSKGLIFIALSSNKIVTFDLKTRTVQSMFDLHHKQDVVFMESIFQSNRHYLVVVSLHTCVIYSLDGTLVTKLNSYTPNTAMSMKSQMYSLNHRSFFTTAVMSPFHEETAVIAEKSENAFQQDQSDSSYHQMGEISYLLAEGMILEQTEDNKQQTEQNHQASTQAAQTMQVGMQHQKQGQLPAPKKYQLVIGDSKGKIHMLFINIME